MIRNSRFFRLGLRRRLTIFSLVIALVPLIIAGISSAYVASTILSDQIGANLQEFATAAKNDTERFLASRLGDVQVVAQSPILTSDQSTPQQKSDFLRAVQKAYGIYAALYVTNPDGLVIASTDQTGGDQSHQAWFQTAKQGKVSATDLYFLTTVQNLVITFSAPISNVNGQFIGVVAGHINSQDLFSTITERKIGKTGELFLVNGDGRIVAEQDPSLIFTDVGDLAPVQAGLQGKSGLVNAVDEDTEAEALYGYSPLSSQVEHWVVLAKLPSAELTQPIHDLELRFALVGLAAVIFVLIAIFGLSRNIVNPIRQLTGIAEKLSEGDFSVQIPTQQMDELGQLATTFEKMVTAIQERDHQLTEQNLDLQEASRLKDVFFATMSHELRTPLNAIIGFSGILSMTGSLTSQGAEMVKRIRANSERLLRLINDILEISRIESGRLVLVRDFIPIRELIDKLQSQMSILAEDKKLEFSTSIADDVPEAFYADQDALTKIIVNLASNAIKFTSAGWVRLAITWETKFLKIEVSDTGIGIPPHMHELIFESFRQADSSTTRAYGGTGLGLSIVRQLCAIMNGSVQVKSEVGKGSTFTVNLPLEVAPEEEKKLAL